MSGDAAEATVAPTVADMLRRNADALAMIDRAASVGPTALTAGGTPYPAVNVLRYVPVWVEAAEVVSVRTLERVGRGDGDGAVASVASEARFVAGATTDTTTLAATQQSVVVPDMVADVVVILRRTTPSEPALQNLDEALARVTAPEDLERLVAGEAEFLSRRLREYDGTLWAWLVRPAIRQVATRAVDSGIEALAVARQPWPERIRGMSQLTDWSRPPLMPSSLRFVDGAHMRQVYATVAGRVAEAATGVNVARVAIALERHRRTTGAYPERLELLGEPPAITMDPFAGRMLRYKPLASGYVLYSIGADGRDDGGDVGALPVRVPPGANGPRDFGIHLGGTS
jgi:hypothetical protein